MFELADRVKVLKPSPTFKISALANKMKAEGRDVLNFSLGEPDFNSPPEVIEEAKKALDAGKTKYTNVDGTPALKKAIVEKLKRENNLLYEPSEVFASVGAKQAIFNAFAASLNKGDEVIIPAPFWVSYADIVEVFEGKPVIHKTTLENKFKITGKELAGLITPKTKWLILNSPSNPTGEVYSKEELASLAKVLLANPHVSVLSDDIYEHLIFEGKKFYNILNIEPKLAERVLVINGVSKSYSMTGFRIGYGAMKNPALIKTIVNLQGQSTSSPCSISQEAATFAINNCYNFTVQMREVMEKRRNIAFEGLCKIKGLQVLKPDGAFYVFFGISAFYNRKTPEGKTLTNDAEVCEYLLEKAGVALVFGSAFGYPDFIRLSYAASEEVIKQGVERITNAFSKLI